jgi:hypothetical protein
MCFIVVLVDKGSGSDLRGATFFNFAKYISLQDIFFIFIFYFI